MTADGFLACEELLRGFMLGTDRLAWSSYLLDTRWAAARAGGASPSDLFRAIDERLRETAYPLDASHQNFIHTVCRHLLVTRPRELPDLDVSFLPPEQQSDISPARAYLRFRAIQLKTSPSPALVASTLWALRNETGHKPGPSKITASWCLVDVIDSLSTDEWKEDCVQ